MDKPDDLQYISAVNFGLNAGLNYKLNDNLLINLTYSHGLSDLLIKIEGDTKHKDYKSMNRVFSIGLNYLF